MHATVTINRTRNSTQNGVRVFTKYIYCSCARHFVPKMKLNEIYFITHSFKHTHTLNVCGIEQCAKCNWTDKNIDTIYECVCVCVFNSEGCMIPMREPNFKIKIKIQIIYIFGSEQNYCNHYELCSHSKYCVHQLDYKRKRIK